MECEPNADTVSDPPMIQLSPSPQDHNLDETYASSSVINDFMHLLPQNTIQTEPIRIDLTLDSKILDSLVNQKALAQTSPQSSNFSSPPNRPSMVDSILSKKHPTQEISQFSELFPSPTNIIHTYGQTQISVPSIVYHRARSTIPWRLVGTFDNEAKLQQERREHRVSKRKQNNLKTGLKVVYRCNSWKRQSCRYSMYALYHPNTNLISMYERGEHTHPLDSKLKGGAKVTKPAYSYGDNPPTMVSSYSTASSTSMVDSTAQFQKPIMGGTSQISQIQPLFLDLPTSSPMENEGQTSNITDSFSGTQTGIGMNDSYEEMAVKAELDEFVNSDSSRHSYVSPPESANQQPGEAPSAPPPTDTPSGGSFSLGDGQNICQLLQIATEMDLTFTFNSRRVWEYCFQSNSDNYSGKTVVFADFGDHVRVSERQGMKEKDIDFWLKANWSQFLWAVRGKCQNALK